MPVNYYRSLETLVDSHPHLCYHFSALALEEIGKIVQSFISLSPINAEKGEKSSFLESDNHIQKLFWALWSPGRMSESHKPEQIELCRKLSREIHQCRLAGLYVDWSATAGVSIPKNVIPKDRAGYLLDVTQSRVSLATMEEARVPDEREKLLMRWFIRAVMDEEKAKLIFSRKSLDKLSELHEGGPWIEWLYEQFEDAQLEAQALLKKELERTEPQGAARSKPKWKIKLRVQSPSHSIRQAELNWFNATGEYIRLDRGRDSTELLITMALPSAISIHALMGCGLASQPKIGRCTQYWVTWILLVADTY